MNSHDELDKTQKSDNRGSESKMNYYERCHKMTHFSVTDYNNSSKEIKRKFQYYDLNTNHYITDWNNISPKEEVKISMIHQYLQVFDYDENMAIADYQRAKSKADQIVDKYLGKHLYPKLDPRQDDTFPCGISEEEFTKLVTQKSEVLHSHIFHMEYVEKHFYWKLENEIYVNFLDE